MDHVGAGEVAPVRELHEVARPQPQAAAVGQQILDGEFGGDVGIVHLEFGEDVDHLVGPAQLLFLDQHGQRSPHEGLGVGGDAEQRVLIDLARRVQRSLAHAFAVDDLVVLDHRHRDARHVEGFHRAQHGFVDPGRADRFGGKGWLQAKAGCQRDGRQGEGTRHTVLHIVNMAIMEKEHCQDKKRRHPQKQTAAQPELSAVRQARLAAPPA
ncbi:conserved hypothetical protein [Ricinus communis]|uniref:Uncharacterized protein n=1 Tax=Ricinus communis TaxID=3988 RepID=B9TAF3_RICCO|nr:conserved hypothetical protein [Ricinus communis]